MSPRVTDPENTARQPAFVVGVGTGVLSLVRALGSRGVPVWACCARRIPGTVSRYARYWNVPDPQLDEAGMVERLLELADRVAGRPIVFTTADHFAQALGNHRDRLEAVATICVAPGAVVDLLVHKHSFSQWAQAHVPSFPRSVPADAFAPSEGLGFPVVVKPYHRGFANAAKLGLPSENELHELRFTLIRDAGEWDLYRQRNSRLLPHMLVQQFIRGDSASKFSVCIYADRQSEIKGIFVGRRVRGFPAQFGDASLIESATVPDSVLDEVRYIVRSLAYSGIAEVEFNQDSETGRFHLLEINPRPWGWIGITTASEADIPWIAYRDLAGNALPCVTHADAGSTKMVLLAQDMSNVFVRFRWDHPEWVMSPAAWWRSLEAKRVVVWEFDRRDLRGTLWCVAVVLRGAVVYVLRGVRNRLFSAVGVTSLPAAGRPQQAD